MSLKAAFIAAVVLAVTFPAGTASASGKRKELLAEFHLRGTHGYRIDVEASRLIHPRRPQANVTVSVEQGRTASSSYSVDGMLTRRHIGARLPGSAAST